MTETSETTTETVEAPAKRGRGRPRKQRPPVVARASSEAEGNQVPESVEAAVVGLTGGARSSRGAPSKSEWVPVFGRLLVYASIGYVWLVTGDNPDDHEDWLLSDAEAKTMAHPLARLFSASQLNKRWGRKLIDSNDVVAAVVVAGLYARRTRDMWKIRPERARERARRGGTEEARGDFPADQFLAS